MNVNVVCCVLTDGHVYRVPALSVVNQLVVQVFEPLLFAVGRQWPGVVRGLYLASIQRSVVHGLERVDQTLERHFAGFVKQYFFDEHIHLQGLTWPTHSANYVIKSEVFVNYMLKI